MFVQDFKYLVTGSRRTRDNKTYRKNLIFVTCWFQREREVRVLCRNMEDKCDDNIKIADNGADGRLVDHC